MTGSNAPSHWRILTDRLKFGSLSEDVVVGYSLNESRW